MDIFDFTKLISPIKRKIFSIIGRGIIAAINNTGKTQVIQIKGMEGELISDIERVQNYGLETSPKPEMEAVAGFINGNREQGLILIIGDRENRPTDLAEGDVCLWDVNGNKVWLKSDQIKIVGDQLNIFAANKSYVLGEDLQTELNKVKDLVTQLQTDINSWVPVPNDGGAAFKNVLAAGYMTKPLPSFTSILSTKIKGE